jgi:hypothetical protein
MHDGGPTQKKKVTHSLRLFRSSSENSCSLFVVGCWLLVVGCWFLNPCQKQLLVVGFPVPPCEIIRED